MGIQIYELICVYRLYSHFNLVQIICASEKSYHSSGHSSLFLSPASVTGNYHVANHNRELIQMKLTIFGSSVFSQSNSLL